MRHDEPRALDRDAAQQPGAIVVVSPVEHTRGGCGIVRRARVGRRLDALMVAVVTFECGCQGVVPLRRLVTLDGSGAPFRGQAVSAAPGESFEPKARESRVHPLPRPRAAGVADIDDARPDQQATPRPSPAPPPTGTAVRSEAGGPGDGPARPARGPWSREAIIAAFHRWATEHGGEAPSSAAWRSPPEGYPTDRTVAYRFGSWSAGLAAAGLTPRPSGRPRRDPSRMQCPTCRGRGDVPREAAA